ncbi:Dps family protein [Paeniglutamicibacter gangotriensis]|uniref:Ferritin Dps family protein n=1 Tax=Paeniglutamicibacter gangotriensis Lz1y TaxID=1276920 RepID=M7MVP7_9MICC|nr:DNA starvation/stationary phase protection protein [Paeniglutamicibacter gangotriensis]EMR00518.1 ferritin Dps family protein [Paeniglutamicibacter gangotriensis Lz1y]
MAAKNSNYAGFTVPGLTLDNGHQVADALQMRIHAFNDLQLTLKHAHWNVVGRDFIGVHEMLDPQIELVRGMIDALAERMATMGVSPNGLPGALVAARAWDDYEIGRASTSEHLAALDLVYTGIIESMRKTIEKVGKLDPVTEDMLIGQTGELEQFQWFMRSHLENDEGTLVTKDARTEKGAAKKAK